MNHEANGVDGDGVGVAEEELDALALGDGAVTGADDLNSFPT